MSLRAAEIRWFPAFDTPYRKTDEKGLYLELRSNGPKLWYFKYRLTGREKHLSLGNWPEVIRARTRPNPRHIAATIIAEGR